MDLIYKYCIAPLWMLIAARSIPEKGMRLSSNKWFVTSSVMWLSRVSIGVVAKPLINSSIIPASNKRSGLKKVSLKRTLGPECPNKWSILPKFALSRLWPNLKAAAANSLTIVASQVGSYPVITFFSHYNIFFVGFYLPSKYPLLCSESSNFCMPSMPISLGKNSE